jgi:hypothetical protein
MYDVIPDIHGDIDRLAATLRALGWQQKARGWQPPEGRRAAFLGDFIDGGAANAAVVSTVRDLIERDLAVAVMGNHELNAVLFHTAGRNKGKEQDGWMRVRSAKNQRQHGSFLVEFPVGADATREVLDWFLTLPLFLELDGMRVVHACWDQSHIDRIAERRPDARLKREDLQEVALEQTPFAKSVAETLNGPDAALPEGYTFVDGTGHRRDRVRLAWWRSEARDWRELALSVPDVDCLPIGPAPAEVITKVYAEHEPTVFVGHYKMLGSPRVERANAICLDYPKAPCAYRVGSSDGQLSTAGLIVT